MSLTPDEVREKAEGRLVVFPSIDQLYRHCADSIADEIIKNNKAGRSTKLILPVGPVGQYPILAQRVKEEEISLATCWFFMMDQQCDQDGVCLPSDHPLSFRRVFDESFTQHLDEPLRIPVEQLIFPCRENLPDLVGMIADLGGIHITYGGIGIHGHLAFNEPEPNVSETDPRIVELNSFTRTINAVRSKVGGNLENFPRFGITLGMRQLLGAKRIRLYCRNGIDLDWANTVLRVSVLGSPGDDYPVTHIRNHPDYQVMTDSDTLKQPQVIL